MDNINEHQIVALAEDFAQRHIAPRRQELITSTDFPSDLWRAFGEQGLTALTAPRSHGGAELNYRGMSKFAATLNRHGRVPGVTMTLLGHLLAIKLHILGDAPLAMQDALLPDLAAGSAIISVAISEPGAGTHPKMLTTRAEKDGNDYILNGEKAFLTKGPMASHFVVLAITSDKDGHKSFSAILVPADTKGLTKTPGVPIDFLHPCPHGGIVMENCRVPMSNLIGNEGEAFERTSLRMRAIEDAVGAGPQVANVRALLADLAEMPNTMDPAEFAGLTTRLQALDVLASHLAGLADAAQDEVQHILECQQGFRQLMHAAARDMQDLLQGSGHNMKPETRLLARDISKSYSIANAAHNSRLKKIGAEILKEPNRI